MVADQLKLGAAQVEPVYHDKEGTIDKACSWIEMAADEDVDLLVFPETFVPGYPYWRGCEIAEWTDRMVDLQENSLTEDDAALDTLTETIAEADLHVALGTNELSERAGSETLYNSIFYFDRAGDLVRKHRKLMPTHEERAIWGRGNPSSLSTHESDIGRIGGLICYENHMTLSKGALAAMGEEIHPAVWPGFWEQHGHPGDKRRAESRDAIETCDQYAAMREYAFETQTYVASCSAYMSDGAFDEFAGPNVEWNIAAGGSMLVNPAGIVKAGPAIGEETLLTAEFDRSERQATKAYFDAVGHYSRWDAVNLAVSEETLEPFADKRRNPTEDISNAEIRTIAEETDVPIDDVEAVVEQLHGD